MTRIVWAIFGNDDDGIYGERSGEPGYHGLPPSAWRAVCWWFRNPFHNLFFRVLVWKGGPFLSVKGCFYIGFRPDTGAFGAALFRGYGE